jgi:peptidoglycan L-alanyl-D-glutamate endopeptidase CwlK
MRDKISIDRLAKLHPKARNVFKAFIEECETTFDITLRISQGLRTFAEQDALYAQGRPKGKIVTNAKGGYSMHNYGMACDFVRMIGKDWDRNYNMKTLAPIALKHGLVWGGTFKTIFDPPHFELQLSNIAGLRALHFAGRVDKDGYVILQ